MVSVRNVYNNGFTTQLAIDMRPKQKCSIHSRFDVVLWRFLYSTNSHIGKRQARNVVISTIIAINIRNCRISWRPLAFLSSKSFRWASRILCDDHSANDVFVDIFEFGCSLFDLSSLLFSKWMRWNNNYVLVTTREKPAETRVETVKKRNNHRDFLPNFCRALISMLGLQFRSSLSFAVTDMLSAVLCLVSWRRHQISLAIIMNSHTKAIKNGKKTTVNTSML